MAEEEYLEQVELPYDTETRPEQSNGTGKASLGMQSKYGNRVSIDMYLMNSDDIDPF